MVERPQQFVDVNPAASVRGMAWPTISTQWLSRQFVHRPRRWPREVRLAGVEKHVRHDVRSLRERARRRRYPDTLSVLVFYWLQTLRETRTDEHWEMLDRAVETLLREAGEEQTAELRALRIAGPWIRSSAPARTQTPRAGNLVPRFTSAHFAPPQFRSGAFLETLLNAWLPAALAEKYGDRAVTKEWNDESANEETAVCLEDILRPWAAFPDIETVQALDRIQKRQPMPAEDVVRWRRVRQASLEALITAPVTDASVVDPRLREILNDVVLYLLCSLEPPPPPEPGYASLFPSPLGNSLPADLAKQVCEFCLPREYVNATELFIPIRTWPEPRWGERSQSLSIHSTLLTPDGGVWEAHHVEQQAGSAPGIVYRGLGPIETFHTEDGLTLKVPLHSCPEEVDPRLSDKLEFQLYGHRWHMERIVAAAEGGYTLYKTASQRVRATKITCGVALPRPDDTPAGPSLRAS